MTTAEIVVRARALGVVLEGRTLTAAVLRLHDETAESTMAQQSRVRDLAESMATAVKDIGQSALVGNLDDMTVGVVLSTPRRIDDDKVLSSLVEALRRRSITPASDRHTDYVVATGSSLSDASELRRSFLEALQVADAAEHEPRLAYYRLPDVRLRGLLHLLRDDERLQTYVERELGPLLVHDDQRKSDLLDILRIYLTHGRNKSSAAEAAHLSRPALYERLNRIERILSVDLDSVESCLSLHVAVLGLDAMSRPNARPSR
jgi:purine catabolism regulator